MQHCHTKLLSEANVKTYRMVSTFCFSVRTSYKELLWCANYLNVYIHTFRENWCFLWGCFPVDIRHRTMSCDVVSTLKQCRVSTGFFHLSVLNCMKLNTASRKHLIPWILQNINTLETFWKILRKTPVTELFLGTLITESLVTTKQKASV